MLCQCIRAGEASVTFRELAHEGFLFGVTSHVGSEGVGGSVGGGFSVAGLPFTGVFFLFGFDVSLVDVGDKRVHVILFSVCAVCP